MCAYVVPVCILCVYVHARMGAYALILSVCMLREGVDVHVSNPPFRVSYMCAPGCYSSFVCVCVCARARNMRCAHTCWPLQELRAELVSKEDIVDRSIRNTRGLDVPPDELVCECE